MERWHNKVAVVTGASCGIGAACCKYLLNNGMIVVGVARRLERIEKWRSELESEEQRSRMYAMHCDVTQESEVQKVFEFVERELGGVAVLVNNAGVVRDTHLVAANNTAELRAILDTNVMGVAFCTREAFNVMQRLKIDGHVFIINSVAGHKVLHFEGISSNMYPASKHAITAMTEVYRQEFKIHKTKTKVTSISPGIVDTEIFTPDQREAMKDMPSLRAEDVADAVIYCLQTPPHVQIHELTIKPVGEPF